MERGQRARAALLPVHLHEAREEKVASSPHLTGNSPRHPPPYVRFAAPDHSCGVRNIFGPLSVAEAITLCGKAVEPRLSTLSTSPMPSTVPSRANIFVQRHERSELAEQIYLSADSEPKRGLGAEPQVCGGVGGPHKGPSDPSGAANKTKNHKRLRRHAAQSIRLLAGIVIFPLPRFLLYYSSGGGTYNSGSVSGIILNVLRICS